MKIHTHLLEENILFKKIKQAILALRAGRPIIVMDDQDRENEGDIILPAITATPAMVSFAANYGRGLMCVALSSEIVHRLQLQPMEKNNQDHFKTNFLQSVDWHASTTGISAYERSVTIKTLADPKSTMHDFRRPGHIFPLGALEGGVLKRAGHTEAGVDLMQLASLPPAAMICEIMTEDGEMRRQTSLNMFAQIHRMPMLSIQDIIQYRTVFHDHPYTLTPSTTIPTHKPWGSLQIQGYESLTHDKDHAIFIVGNPKMDQNPLVRIHSECLTGDVFGSMKCDCQEQLNTSLQYMHQHDGGIILYLRQEGRGIGLFQKLQAYTLQQEGLDTVDANLQLGLPDDARTYEDAVFMLKALMKNRKMYNNSKNMLPNPALRLISNNPKKIQALSCDFQVTPISLSTPVHSQNKAYLKTKKDKLNHKLDNIS